MFFEMKGNKNEEGRLRHALELHENNTAAKYFFIGYMPFHRLHTFSSTTTFIEVKDNKNEGGFGIQ
jgi:hypothetical protein